jgi:two-component system, cell cycle sensor histidine kinase and response regulator CckA
VLLVEDDDSVRKLVREMLSMQGYRVIDTGDPIHAEQLARQEEGINLLLTDVVMPHMSGKPLADKIAEARPGVKTLFMSGYAVDAITNQVVLDQDMAFLPKPFSSDALAAKIQEVLETGGATCS